MDKKLAVYATILLSVFFAFVGVMYYFSFPPNEVVSTVTVDIQSEIDLNDSSKNFFAILTVSGKYNISDINASSILLEDIISPESWDIDENKLFLEFDSNTVINVIWSRTYHMGITVGKDIELKITGKIDSKLFEAKDTVAIK